MQDTHHEQILQEVTHYFYYTFEEKLTAVFKNKNEQEARNNEAAGLTIEDGFKVIFVRADG